MPKPPASPRVLLPGLLLTAAFLGCARVPELKEPPPIPVTVSRPLQKAILDTDEYTGVVESIQVVEVRSRVRGEVQEVLFKDGQEVEAGDPLFILDPRPFQAEIDKAEQKVLQAKAEENKARKELTRTQQLVTRNAASQADLDAALAEQKIAAAAISAAEAEVRRLKLDLDYSKIAAPISGKISRALVTKGNLVNATGDTLLTTIVAMDPMYVYFYVNERALLKYQKMRRDEARARGDKLPDPRDVKIPVTLRLAVDTGENYKGEIDFLDNQVDPGTGTIRARARFDNKDRGLTPGLFARITVEVSEPYPALLVPDSAVLSDLSRKYVLTVDRDTVVRELKSTRDGEAITIPVHKVNPPTYVELGRLVGEGERVVKTGLSADQWVIVDGAVYVRQGTEVTVTEPKEDGPEGADDAPAAKNSGS